MNITAMALLCLSTKPAILSVLRLTGLWVVLSIALSHMSINDGRTVTEAITPSTTPFAITIPRSAPSVKLIKHRAMKPAIVVTELADTDAMVALIASAIAAL